MTKKKNDIIKAQQIIGVDRLLFDENFERVFLTDFETVIREYFDCKKSPTLSVSKNGGSINVEVRFVATRIKSFGLLKK